MWDLKFENFSKLLPETSTKILEAAIFWQKQAKRNWREFFFQDALAHPGQIHNFFIFSLAKIWKPRVFQFPVKHHYTSLYKTRNQYFISVNIILFVIKRKEPRFQTSIKGFTFIQRDLSCAIYDFKSHYYYSLCSQLSDFFQLVSLGTKLKFPGLLYWTIILFNNNYTYMNYYNEYLSHGRIITEKINF